MIVIIMTIWLWTVTYHFEIVFLTDMIAVLGESTGYLALKQMRRSMQLDTEGQRILRYL